MVENNSIELTEQETELYDRQIRLWGLESQKRYDMHKTLDSTFDTLFELLLFTHIYRNISH